MSSPSRSELGAAVYAAKIVPGRPNYYVAKDAEAFACLLIATYADSKGHYPPIRLEGLDVQFELLCHVSDAEGRTEKRTLTVFRSRDRDDESTHVFFLVCEAMIRRLGDDPRHSEVVAIVDHLSEMFERARRVRARSIAGLFGELYMVLESADAVESVSAWHMDARDRFDFAVGDFRLDVKTTSGRRRMHTFSFDQCNPAQGVVAAVASLFAEEVGVGLSLRAMVQKVEDRVSGYPNLVFKLHTIVASTLGSGLDGALSKQFDVELAKSSLRFFIVSSIPAIRGDLPAGVSDVHFRSDLAIAEVSSVEELSALAPMARGLLPRTPQTLSEE